MKSTITGLFRAGAVGAAVLALAACGGGGGGSGSSSTASGMGTLRVALTDAPACGFDSVNVTVDRVRVNQSAEAADTDAGWSDIALSQPTKIDLLSLTNGVLFSLGQTALPAGQYQQVRLVLAANSGSGSPANSVTPTGGVETALQTPSAMQSGIKLISPFTVQPGTLVDLVLDFDACKSIVTLGNGRFLLKPVIAVTPQQVSGTISGQLTTTISGTAVTQASVSAQKDGTVIRATVPSASGAYTLAPIDARSQPYDLVVTMSGAATSVVSGVPVTAGNTTNVPPISLTPSMSSSMGAVSGSVSPAAALPATVRALQQVGAVPQVEVASTNTDGAGAYSLSAPKAAAWLAPYSASTLSFSASGTATTAAKYTIEAKDAAGSTQTQPADISSANVTNLNFVFP